MKLFRLLTIICLSLFALSNAQQAPTSAETIKSALEQKRQMEENSIVKNVPFRNVGPSIMSCLLYTSDAADD